jgi:hypothetical protein
MIYNNIPDIKEILEFELIHLENEFEDYKLLYPIIIQRDNY